MRRLLLALSILLGSAAVASAQSGGSSAAGGGLSTKAILALEECFDDFDTFICTGGGGSGTVGPGTTNRIAKFTAATTVGDSQLVDTGTNLSGAIGGTISLMSTGSSTYSSSDTMTITASGSFDMQSGDEVTLFNDGGAGDISFGDEATEMAIKGNNIDMTTTDLGSFKLGPDVDNELLFSTGKVADITADGEFNISSGSGDIFIDADGALGLISGGDTDIDAENIDLNAGGAFAVRIPNDVELQFGTTATAGSPATIDWNTFAGAGFERLEIVGGGNAGVLVQHGSGAGSGGFVVADNEGSFVHTFTQNAPAPAGTSRPSWIMAVTAPSSMDDVADQRVGLELDMESGATDVAGAQQIGFFIDPIVARASTQDQIVLSTTGWDNNIVFGSEVSRTQLNFAATSGINTVTIPAATGTMAVFPLAANTIVTNSGVEMQFGGASTSIEGDGSILTLTGANGETIMVGASIDIDGNGEDMTMLSSGATVTMGGGDEAWEFSVDSFDVTAADGAGFDVTGGFVALATGTHTFFADTSALLGDPVLQIGDGNSGVSDIGASLTETISVLDGGDTYSGFLVGLTNANHTGTGNLLQGINVANITGDADATEVAQIIGSGWDYSQAWTVLSASPPNLSTNEVGFFLDENTDRVATATNDCALVARLSDGTEINIAILVTDGGCP